MNTDTRQNSLNGMEAGPFEFQNWKVYGMSIRFTKEVSELCKNLPNDGRRGLADQLTRASQSIVLNLAEGCSRGSGKDKANFWRMSKGSAFECVAVLDILFSYQVIERSLLDRLLKDLAEIGKMLSGLIRFIENR